MPPPPPPPPISRFPAPDSIMVVCICPVSVPLYVKVHLCTHSVFFGLLFFCPTSSCSDALCTVTESVHCLNVKALWFNCVAVVKIETAFVSR